MHYWRALLLFLLFQATAEYILYKKTDQVIPGNAQFILMDTSNTLSIQDALQSPNKFIVLNHETTHDFTNKQNVNATYWISFDLKNNSGNTRWVLELADPHIATVDVYLVDPSGRVINSKHSGYHKEFSKRTIKHKNHVFEISPEKSSRYIIRLKSPTISSFVLLLKPSSAFINYSLKEFFFLGCYYGIMLIMMLYNLYLYFLLRKKIQLFYVGYVLACMLHSMQEDGLGFQFLWGNYPEINSILYPVSHLGLLFSFSFYSIEFLHLKQKLKRYYYLGIGLSSLYGIYFLFTYILSETSKGTSIVYLLPFSILYIAGIQSYRNNNREARFYLIAYSALAIGLLIFVLRIKGFIPSTIFTVYSFNIALLLEVVIMSYALADRMRILIQEREQAQHETITSLQERDQLKNQLLDEKQKINRELELKVQERTNSLNKANDELNAAYEKLNYYTRDLESMNSELDKNNWELNKEIKNKVVSNIIGTEISFDEFSRVFPHDNACLKFMSELKWKDGYTCIKCKNTKFNSGEKPFSRKCTRCGYRETATAHTLFHSTRFELNKAFYLTYLSVSGKDQRSNEEISELLKLRASTCFQFRKKVKEILKQHGHVRSWEELVLI